MAKFGHTRNPHPLTDHKKIVIGDYVGPLRLCWICSKFARFWWVMAQTTRTHSRVCPWGFRWYCCSFSWWNTSKPQFFSVGRKSQTQNIITFILSKLMHRLKHILRNDRDWCQYWCAWRYGRHNNINITHAKCCIGCLARVRGFGVLTPNLSIFHRLGWWPLAPQHCMA